MPTPKDQAIDEFSPEETAQRRDEVLRRMIGTPPTQQADMAPPKRPYRKKVQADAVRPARKRGGGGQA